MLQKLRAVLTAGVVLGLPALLTILARAESAPSGQRTYGQVVVEPALDLANGSTVYLHMPAKAPVPSKANRAAVAPLYLPLYPLISTVSVGVLNCHPDNCEHVNVLPFSNTDYGALPGAATPCKDFNGGQDCSEVKGHDHLVAAASTQGDFNVAWNVKLVVFTHAAFLNGKINSRITTLDQLNALMASKDVMIIETPIVLTGSLASERTYELGTPVVIPYP